MSKTNYLNSEKKRSEAAFRQPLKIMLPHMDPGDLCTEKE